MTFQERSKALQQINLPDPELRAISRSWVESAGSSGRHYLWDWLGRPIIQLPTDIVQLQELIFLVKPDLIIETGVARGGSIVFSASMLALLEYNDAAQAKRLLNPQVPTRIVCGIDIEVRDENRMALESHPMASRIMLIEGSSTDRSVIKSVADLARRFASVMVLLDSNHTYSHVLAELEAYSGLVTPGSYLIVFDTNIEDMPASLSQGRPWGPGNNPKTAVHQWLKGHPEFEIDKDIDNKLLISVAPDGYLKRIR